MDIGTEKPPFVLEPVFDPVPPEYEEPEYEEPGHEIVSEPVQPGRR